MPHDKNGELLSVGDEVIIRFKVDSINMQEDYCNVTLSCEHPQTADGAMTKTSVCCNARACEKA